MKTIKINEIKKLGLSEISEQITEVQKHLLDLKIKHTTRQQIKTHMFKKYKRMLAQLLTEQKKIIDNKTI